MFKEKVDYKEKAKKYMQEAREYEYISKTKEFMKTYKWASMNSVVAGLCVCMFSVIIAVGVQRGDIRDIQEYVVECGVVDAFAVAVAVVISVAVVVHGVVLACFVLAQFVFVVVSV
jgi:hypothetical protein